MTAELTFGEWLKRRRGSLGLTQKALAHRVGYAEVTLRKVEANELRPSHQMAEKLAEVLHLAPEEWPQFVRFARDDPGWDDFALLPTANRTKYRPVSVRATPPVDSIIGNSILSSTHEPTASRANLTSELTSFVDRKPELAQLDRLLTLACAGKGRVAFVTGEAGSGKSTLVQAFARRAQAQHPDLVVATGSCQAFAGIGDPYLPFRELLALLTGDVEARWASGTISRNQAVALLSLLPQAIQTLLTDSPNLIDTLIAGAALLQRVQTAVPAGALWVTQLATYLNTHAAGRTSPMQQQEIFAQTTRFLTGLARQQPLLLVLDDLQWADAGSLHLLFHLGRQLAGNRILLLGLYRPADVALGRPASLNDPTWPTATTERHPLVPVVAELQRTYGEPPIDLQQADGHTFIQALLSSQLYRLHPTFAATLYQHTEGQALFTVELLRSLQARGDLLQDEQGVWVEGPTLNWETLPAQVEGIIGERIGRVPQPLQTLLTIAAIEGEIFTAEVIVKVMSTTIQGISAAQVIQQLSNVLDKQHGLVRVQDVQNLPTGRLSRYRFRHHLFQKYIYQRLDAAERTTMHEAVGQALVQCYGNESTTIAPQLARHFELAGRTAMALVYLRQAGDTAARLFANTVAADYYRRALAVATTTTNAGLIHLYSQLSSMMADVNYDQASVTYTAWEELARQRGDQAMELAALMAKLPLYTLPTHLQNHTVGQTHGQQALHLARSLQDQKAEIQILWNLSIAAVQALQIERAIDYGEQLLALARAIHLVEQTALTLTHLAFFCYILVGRFTDAERAVLEVSTIWRQLNNVPLLSNNLAALGRIYMFMGRYQQGMVVIEDALQLVQPAKNPVSQMFSAWSIGYIYWEQGEVDRAYQAMAEGIRIGEQAGFALVQVELYASIAAFYGELGAYESGRTIAATAVTLAQTNGQNALSSMFRGIVRKVLAQLHLHQCQITEAKGILSAECSNPALKAMSGYFTWYDVNLVKAELAFQEKAYGGALSLIEQHLANVRLFGIRSRLPYALHMQGKIYLALGDRGAAQSAWQSARAEAEALGSRWALWQILATLAQIEEDAEQAAQLCGEAQAIVTYVADHISEPDLRVSFLNLPAVCAIATAGKK